MLDAKQAMEIAQKVAALGSLLTLIGRLENYGVSVIVQIQLMDAHRTQSFIGSDELLPALKLRAETHIAGLLADGIDCMGLVDEIVGRMEKERQGS